MAAALRWAVELPPANPIGKGGYANMAKKTAKGGKKKGGKKR
jgi:hypothetical protein